MYGCGFQPLLPLNNESGFSPIYLDARDSLSREIKRELEKRNAFTASAITAASELLLSDYRLDERNFSVTSDGRNAEYLLIMTVQATWRRSQMDEQGVVQREVLLRQAFSEEATFTGNPLNPSAEGAERKQVRERLETRLAEAIIASLSWRNELLIGGSDASKQKDNP